MTREPDLTFEALAEATGTDWTAGRGELNSALASIRSQWQGEEDEIAEEIKERARLYRRVMPGVMCTPTALAKHWKRVFEEAHQRSQEATNVSPPRNACGTCDGHRFVLVGTRPFPQTHWATTNGHTAHGHIEEYAPCPACSPEIDGSFRRHDGTMARVPDPEKVRELLSR